MVGIFVMLIVTIALVAGASASAYFLLNSTQASLMVQQNQIRVQAVSSSIRSNIATFGGRDVIPLKAGAGSDDFLARVPSLAAFDKTMNGRDIVFCPVVFSNSINKNAELVNATSDGGERYDIEVSPQGSKPYMIAGYPDFQPSKMKGASRDAIAKELNDAGIYGFLLSPDPRVKDDLRCSNITKVDVSNYIILGGTVQPVYGSVKDIAASTYVIAPGATAELGADEKPVGSLGDALKEIVKFNQSNATIKLAASETVDGQTRQELQTVGFGRALRIVGNGTSALSFDTSASLRLQGDISFENLFLKSGVQTVGIEALPTSRVSLGSVVLGAVRASGGTVYMNGDTHIVVQSGSPVIASGGVISIDVGGDDALNAGSDAPVFDIAGGEVLIQRDLNVTAPSGYLYRPNSAKSVQLINGAKVYLNGQVPAVTITEPYERVVNSCANGSTSCVAECKSDKIVAWGECTSSNHQALSGFFADTAQSYKCEWAPGVEPVSEPTVGVVCTTPQH